MARELERSAQSEPTRKDFLASQGVPDSILDDLQPNGVSVSFGGQLSVRRSELDIARLVSFVQPDLVERARPRLSWVQTYDEHMGSKIAEIHAEEGLPVDDSIAETQMFDLLVRQQPGRGELNALAFDAHALADSDLGVEELIEQVDGLIRQSDDITFPIFKEQREMLGPEGEHMTPVEVFRVLDDQGYFSIHADDAGTDQQEPALQEGVTPVHLVSDDGSVNASLADSAGEQSIDDSDDRSDR